MAVLTNNAGFNSLFYVGFNKNQTEWWPYLPKDLEHSKWIPEPANWLQFFFLVVTLISNLIPLSLYVTVELVQFCMLWFIYVDVEMYDDTTDTRALASSTIVSDLGRIQYFFSDKTVTLTQNVMWFKRCSVDGMAFGTPIQRMRPVGGGSGSRGAIIESSPTAATAGRTRKFSCNSVLPYQPPPAIFYISLP